MLHHVTALAAYRLVGLWQRSPALAPPHRGGECFAVNKANGGRGSVVCCRRGETSRGHIEPGLRARGDDGVMQPHEGRRAGRRGGGGWRASDEVFAPVLGDGEVVRGRVGKHCIAEPSRSSMRATAARKSPGVSERKVTSVGGTKSASRASSCWRSSAAALSKRAVIGGILHRNDAPEKG